ncbi:ATP-binding cassette domain-containing protein [candidate division NPL-UPA2 bacterium]|nr:ATP-binding cassette domain-containing protein [candidate division NPL-UPA2 bacterium]
MKDIILEVKNLSKRFTLHLLGEKMVPGFHKVSFTLKRGEFLGVTGKSGSGKSSLIKCIYRTYLPTEGEIIYYYKNGNSVDLATCSDKEIVDLRRERIGYVSQFFYTIPRISCLEIVSQALIQQGIDKNKAERKAKSMLSRFLIPENLFGAYPSTFSGGEKQRVNIAQAITRKIDLLLIDEPLASLDKKTKDIVLKEILKLKKRGTSVIGIFHDEKELRSFADRILVMENGKGIKIYENHN